MKQDSVKNLEQLAKKFERCNNAFRRLAQVSGESANKVRKANGGNGCKK